MRVVSSRGLARTPAPCPWLPALKTAEQAVADLHAAILLAQDELPEWVQHALVDLTRLRFQKEGKA